jgi:hypothetical protein
MEHYSTIAKAGAAAATRVAGSCFFFSHLKDRLDLAEAVGAADAAEAVQLGPRNPASAAQDVVLDAESNDAAQYEIARVRAVARVTISSAALEGELGVLLPTHAMCTTNMLAVRACSLDSMELTQL